MTVRGLRDGLPWGALGMAALLALVEYGVSQRAHVFLPPNAMDWKVSGRDVSEEAPGRDVLCFGDSMLKFGVAPPVLERRLGCSAYCLALMDGKPAASYFLLRRAIEAGARPAVVLVDFQPECLFEPTGHLMENQNWKALLSLRECWDVFLTYRDPDFLARTVLARFLPTLRCREGMRADVRLALEGKSSPFPGENARFGRNRRVNRGGVLLPKNPAYRGEFPSAYHKIARDDWFDRPEHTSYVRRFFELAGARGARVVWVLPPNAPAVQAARERSGLSARYTAYVRGLQQQYAHVTVIDARTSRFDHTVFIDPVHLDRDGAAALSVDVAEVLRPLLGPPRGADGPARWVSLGPSPGPARRDLALEDVEQSSVRRVRR